MARIPYLSALIPSDALFWHSLDQNVTDGANVTDVTDDAAALDLVVDEENPVWRELANTEKYIEFDGTRNPLTADGFSITLKHLFIAAAFDGATFDDTNGLFAPAASASSILVGESGTTKFFNFSLPSLVYQKSGAVYAAANMQAPVNDIPELIEWYYPTGFALTNLQIGKDRDFAGRLWKGQFHFAAGFSRQLSTLETAQLRLYANLKSGLWLALNQTLDFPAANIIFDGRENSANTDKYSRFYASPLNFDEVTDSHTYDDGSKTFNTTALRPPRRWQIEFNGISAAKAQVLDAFSENVGKNRSFNFYDYKRERTYTGVRIENYSREHEAHKSFSNNCRFNLVKY